MQQHCYVAQPSLAAALVYLEHKYCAAGQWLVALQPCLSAAASDLGLQAVLQ